MDIFRSATIAIALVLLIFMIIVLYYEFKSSKLNSNFPPYVSDCPDYSYSTHVPTGSNIPQGTNHACKFNETFDYSKLVSTWNTAPGGVIGDNPPLCENLYCTDSSGSLSNCTWSPNAKPSEMYFLTDSKGSTMYNNARNCHLTFDGIV